MKLYKLGRLWRTVRHLRYKQVIHRVVFRLAKPRPDHRPAPSLRETSSNWHSPVKREPSMIAPRQFLVLGQNYDLALGGWNPNNLSKLTCYNLHYFDDLNAKNSCDRLDWHKRLIASWIDQNPAPDGNGWEPYPLSLRVVNWIKWAQTHPESLTKEMVHSLAVQVRFLTRRLEWHLMGNHLFVNAKALIFAGLFFQGDEADRWRTMGLDILKQQIPEQILLDGGHFELSPMYHSLATEDLLDLIVITRRYEEGLTSSESAAMADWPALIQPMLTWLSVLTHPDGKLSFFNDAAFGIAPDLAELCGYAERIGLSVEALVGTPIHELPKSGYYRLSRGAAVVMADLAAVGPAYLPGHAHADTLSFEMSLAGQRVIINGGTSIYGTGAERHNQRSTISHSTLCLEKTNSSEVWSGFRVGRRARIIKICWSDKNEATYLAASHDGYRNMQGKPIHQRQWALSNRSLAIIDKVKHRQKRLAEAFFHLHPSVSVEMISRNEAQLHTESYKICVRASPEATMAVVPGFWHPEFGVSIPNQALCVRLSGLGGDEFTTDFKWEQL